MKLFLLFAILFVFSCTTRKYYYETEEYRCKRVCIEADKNFKSVEEPNCLCENKKIKPRK